MDVDKVYETVEATKEHALQRQIIINYLNSCVKLLETDPEARQDIAFNITSLSSTEYAQSLNEEDALSITFKFSIELETADENHEDWILLVDLIKSLE
jgi:urease accessory protein UreF